MKCISIILLSGIFAFPLSSYSQQSHFEQLKEKYPREVRIILNEETTLELSLKGDSVYIEKHVFVEDMYLSHEAPSYAERSIEYSGFDDIIKIKAKSVLPENEKSKTYSVRKFDVNKSVSDRHFYGNESTVNFTFPKLKQGGKSIVEYTQHIKHPLFMPSEYFQSRVPVLNKSFRVIVDKDIDLDFHEYNFSEIMPLMKMKSQRGKIVYSLDLQNIEPYSSESSSPSVLEFIPHIRPYIRSYISDEKSIRVIDNTDDLFDWYVDWISSLDTTTNASMVSLVDSVVRDLSSDIQKVKYIYKWVQDNINYVAFEDDMGGFIPRNPKDVCRMRFGDCKDMASLIISLCHLADIKVHYAWVGTRDLPYHYTKTPGIHVDNHMIAVYEDDNGDYYFLDATDEYLLFDMPPEFIQGKEILLYLDSSNYRIIKAPVVHCLNNGALDKARCKLVDEKLVGKAYHELYGYSVSNHYRISEDMLKRDPDKEYGVYFRKGNNKCSIRNIQFKDSLNRVNVNYSFEIEDYIRKWDDEIIINMNLEKLLSSMKIPNERKQAIVMDNTYSFKKEYELEIPEGYQVSFLPASLDYSISDASVQINYSKRKNSVVYNLDLCMDSIRINPDQFDEWRVFLKKLKKAYRDNIVLQKSS